jgi:hypothetical protein
VEHRSLLNRSGICDELTVVIFFVHAAVLSIKTAFNLVKIHLLFRIKDTIDSVKRNVLSSMF